jgi:hypothetical protein
METHRRPRHDATRSDPRGPVTAVLDPLEDDTSTEASVVSDVQVIYGASTQTLALAGLTIAEARPLLVTVLSIDRRARALVNGRPASESYVLARRDALEFVHHAGEKGQTRWSCASKSWAIGSCVSRTAPRRLPRP